MNRPEFFTQYIATYLATYAALNSTLLPVESLSPVDEAVTLAGKAWLALDEYKKAS